MASRNLYPPVIADYVPAFNTDVVAIPFTLSKFNVSTDIANVQVSVCKQNNGASIINDIDGNGRYRRNGKIIINVPMLNKYEKDESGNNIDTGVKYFTLSKEDIYKG